MKAPKQRLLTAASVFIVAGIAVYSLLSFIARSHRADVQQELRKLLGADVSFEVVEAGLWDGFGFSVKEFRVADDSRFAATPL
ncbi:MAG TPA: hypothetical protein VHM64_20650, partial [Candidatus Binatia bacterium]|nr:hypothetical protein [Candidatus Binatia bacterium]